MKSERWEAIETLFHAARELHGEERASFLDKECGAEGSLRRRVDALLRGDEKAEGILNVAAWSIANARIGPYEIVDWLGAGGMGEVYRAHDTTLKRDVAIKVLPEVFSRDPDRIARFQREAEVLAKLNHPNIAAIYGLEEAAGGRALILELVEGPTLADRIAQGAISIGEALPIARQIAEALDAAHERGVIHRDLKPANIKITLDGTVKVLDFGLAKVRGDEPAEGAIAMNSQNSMNTAPGLIIGTVAYMSPEQARGKLVDKRADIWAFGCILYEMLAGRAPFERDTVADTLAAIIECDPEWSALPAPTPASVQRLVFRCLDKDLRGRLHDIADARVEIEDILNGAAPTPPEVVAIDRPHLPGGLRWSTVVFASLVALVVIGGLTWRVFTTPQRETTTQRIVRFAIASSDTVTVRTAAVRSVAMTPDGTSVIYKRGNTYVVRALDQLEPTTIVMGAAPLNHVFVSPNGQWVGFVEGKQLKKVPLTGGPAVPILGSGRPSQGATWAPDDTIIMADDDLTTGLERVSAEGGAVSVLTRPVQASGERDHIRPEMLPGGRAVLFTITAVTGGIDAAQVAVLDLTTLKYQPLLGGSDAHYVPSGHLVYTAGGALRAIAFDPVRLKTLGTSVSVLPRVVTKVDGGGDFDVAANGTLVFVDAPGGTAQPERTLVWVDRQGREELLGAPAGPYLHPRVSPDGTRVAMSRAQDIWIWDLARRKFMQLTFTPTGENSPVWLDRSRLAFFSPGAVGKFTLFWQLADSNVAAEGLGAGPPSSVTPDGRLLFSPGGKDLMLVALDGTRRVQTLLQTPAAELNGVVSPDGKWLAYESDRSGQSEIYVAPYPSASVRQWKISSGGGTRPLWAPIGHELFYVSDGAVMAVHIDTRGQPLGDTIKVVEALYAPGGPGFLSARNYDVSPDGKRFLMLKSAADQSPAPQIIVVQNWSEALKRLVPTN